jgi:hypothetical protein
MEELLKLLGFTTPLIYAGAAYGLFHWLDENASDEAKAALAQTMRFKDYKSAHLASALVEVFDRIYTHPLLRWRAFFRSLVFTTVVAAIYVFEYYNPYVLVLPIGWERLLLIALLFNIPSDYLSLFLIRPLLIRSGMKPVIGLALGTVTGAAIVLAGDFLRRNFLVLWSLAQFDGWQDVLLSFEVGPLYAELRWFFEPGIFAWPALAVFVWLPLFALGILTARVLTPLTWIVGRTQWFLKEGKEHPLKAIGYVAAVAVFVGTIAARAVFSS